MRSPRTVNLQGRQKSCSECAKAKRRCDLRQPMCLRCRKQCLTCNYPCRPLSRSTNAQDDTPNALNDFNMQVSFTDAENTEALALNFDLGTHAIPTASNTEFLDFDFSAGIDSLESLDNLLQNPFNLEDRVAQKSVGGQFLATNLAPSIKSRVEYAIEQFKLVPKMMVELNATPWMHPMLYNENMSRHLQDAHAACALYIAKNDTNAEFVARHITVRVKELTASSIPTTTVDVLTRAHALVLYQLMLMFGGELHYCGQAEMLLPQMEKVGESLLAYALQQTDPIGPLPLYPSVTAHSAWNSYIFRESVRRTVLSLFQLIGLCRLRRGQIEPCRHSLSQGSRVTLSAHLWHAKTAFDFAVAWNEKKHFLVKELDFTDTLRDARPDDLDIFTKMLLVTLRGIDDIKGWFYIRGGAL